MKRKLLLLGMFMLNLFHSALAQSQVNERAKWFVDDRFGMFIHWGIYSGIEGIWKGEKLRHGNDYAEWVKYRNQIDSKEYLTALNRFDWDSIDPEKWVILAKKAGMKYVTLTAKHHDGFALWNSQASDYNITKLSPGHRDIVKELAAACKKHGLKMGLYYSHWIDWNNPNSWSHEKEIYGLSEADYDRYWQNKVVPQLTELLTQYGDLGLIWFDMWEGHEKTVVTAKQLFQIKALIRKYQPNCLINSRLGLSIEEDPDVDFRTLGDNQFGDTKLDYPWQSPATVAHSWGYNAYETQWKSTTALLKNLIKNVSLNGNMMLNIGPRANGDVPFEIEDRLTRMGEWLDANGESIYGAQAFDLKADTHEWGDITCKSTKEGKFRLYLHVYNWPLNKKLILSGVEEAPKAAFLLVKPDEKIEVIHQHFRTELTLPAAPDKYVSVLVLEYEKKPTVDNTLIAETSFGGFSLKPQLAFEKEGDAKDKAAARFETIPPHVEINEVQQYTWQMYIPKAGKYRIDLSYAFEDDIESNSKMKVKMAEQSLVHQVEFTGQTVGEPLQDWHIDRYLSHSIGSIKIPAPGIYSLHLDAKNISSQKLKFQWIWLEKQK
ncbi:alpha-L-fucosidase [Marinilongibacter aquaticus]|uniref:alpha-L-fucosidase n=1 Tax=Marinilongibacter aquaticus TaxID=2975157 RepID=UPI0021BD8214|nr:alpha-L-fucosidase [Marinilongibacter aquaticus]UBM57815.1 alpha-L-fucosidase [Marinilongibacter aquaticus]